MDNFKDWYSNRKGKYILFFGFYIIFFIVLAIILRNANYSPTEEPKKEENIETEIETNENNSVANYDITNLVNKDFKYKIVIDDNSEIINFEGSKNKIDYANFTNKYFLDIYNINQLLKKSKYIGRKDNVLSFELTNSSINEILLSEKKDGINPIMVHVNNNNEVNKIVLDLANYFDKVTYEIDISYIVGDSNENSSS